MRVFTMMAALLAALTVSAAIDTAEARRGGGGGGRSHAVHSHSFSAPRSFHAPRVVRHVHVAPRHFNRNYFHAGPRHVVSDRCAWLRHRALATGSRYWWKRYHACRQGLFY